MLVGRQEPNCDVSFPHRARRPSAGYEFHEGAGMLGLQGRAGGGQDIDRERFGTRHSHKPFKPCVMPPHAPQHPSNFGLRPPGLGAHSRRRVSVHSHPASDAAVERPARPQATRHHGGRPGWTSGTSTTYLTPMGRNRSALHPPNVIAAHVAHELADRGIPFVFISGCGAQNLPTEWSTGRPFRSRFNSAIWHEVWQAFSLLTAHSVIERMTSR